MIGYYNEDPIINPDEVEDWKWMGIDAVKENMVLFPEQYTVWFKIILMSFYHFF
jgi:isopentenyl-diphosphate delta-isomerase